MEKSLKYNKVGWVFVVVPVLAIALFYFYPMLDAFLLSFKSGMGVSLSYAGLQNWRRLFSDPNFTTALANTMTYLVIQVPVMLVLAMLLSVLLNNENLKFRGLFRTAIFLPAVTSLVAYSVVFKYMFSADGIVNQFLMKLSLIEAPIFFLSDPFWGKVVIILAITWRWTGYNMIFYLSALQNVDKSVYEAARVDGANVFQQFFKITMPMLRPIILFTTITSTIGTLQLFDEILNITGGGPGNSTLSISKYIYDLSFKYTPDFGYAATVSYVIVIIVVALSVIQFRLGGEKE